MFVRRLKRLLLLVVLYWVLKFLLESFYDENSQLEDSKISRDLELVQRVVAVGDLHGDLPNTLKVFQLAGIINENREWAAGTTIFVQTGDIVDRGPDTKAIYSLMQNLTAQARKVGGQVVGLLGNHEILNLLGDVRYVSPEDIVSFGGPLSRRKAWQANAPLGKYLRSLDTAANIHRTVFVHGGISPEWAALGIKYINSESRRLLSGSYSIQQIFNERILTDENCPTWYRGYALSPEPDICKVLEKALKLLKADRMVMGHTPQFDGKIRSRCNGKIFLIDVAITKAYGAAGSAALEILLYKDARNRKVTRVNALYRNERVPLS